MGFCSCILRSVLFKLQILILIALTPQNLIDVPSKTEIVC